MHGRSCGKNRPADHSCNDNGPHHIPLRVAASIIAIATLATYITSRDFYEEAVAAQNVHPRVERGTNQECDNFWRLAVFVGKTPYICGMVAIEDTEVTRLNGEDFGRLIRNLDANPGPNAALKKAAKRYRALQGNDAVAV
jgi:hypothetical protein